MAELLQFRAHFTAQSILHMEAQNSPKSIDKELFCDVVLTVGVFKSKVELVIVVLEDILIEPSSLLYLISISQPNI